LVARPEGLTWAEVAPVATLHRRALRVVPAERPAEATSEVAPLEAEPRAYGVAHRAHFVAGVPARALAAWDAYLAAYPDGRFAYEARYNRALCLVRLERLAEARRALRALVTGYRRSDVQILLGWLEERIHAQ
jgi:hypothetical protein